MDIEKLANRFFALDDVEQAHEMNLFLFHQIIVNSKSKTLGDIRALMDTTSFEQLEDLYSEIKWTECMGEDGESYQVLGEKVLFHIGEKDNTYFNNYFWKQVKPIEKKKFI